MSALQVLLETDRPRLSARLPDLDVVRELENFRAKITPAGRDTREAWREGDHASGPLNDGGGWYYRTIAETIDDDGDMYALLDVLAQDVGIRAIFSDWPATVTYYANCMGLE